MNKTSNYAPIVTASVQESHKQGTKEQEEEKFDNKLQSIEPLLEQKNLITKGKDELNDGS